MARPKKVDHQTEPTMVDEAGDVTVTDKASEIETDAPPHEEIQTGAPKANKDAGNAEDTTEKSASSGESPKKSRIGKRNKELGRRGEEAAARFLDQRGYEILERNWTCFAGEADIIAKDGNAIVFVEVKTRKDCQKGFPSEAVTLQKRARYEKIALAFMADHDYVDMQVRFDVISLVVVAKDRAMMRHHINAFSAA